jgi:phytoene synthase
MQMGISQAELDHCNELALLPGSLFEFTSRFLSNDQRTPLLALYALVKAVGSISQAPVEDSVKWAKLKWWSEELSADPASGSRHPVLRVLWSSGARTSLDGTRLQGLVRDAIMQIDAAPNSDENALFERFAALGSTGIRLELALDKAEIETKDLDYLGAATSMFRMISGFGSDQWPQTTEIPLSLLAKHNISHFEPGQAQQTQGLEQVMKELNDRTMDWFSKGLAGLSGSLKTGQCTHLQLRLAMENRYLEKIQKNKRTVFDVDQHYGPGDAWFAWRFLRRLK